jgi:hypothetical protein
MVKNPIIFQCALCPATLDTGTASEEKAGQFAAKERWLLGLPHGTVWCRRCAFLGTV